MDSLALEEIKKKKNLLVWLYPSSLQRFSSFSYDCSNNCFQILIFCLCFDTALYLISRENASHALFSVCVYLIQKYFLPQNDRNLQ